MGLRGGQRGGWGAGVGRRAARGGVRGTERCPRDLMLGLVRTRQFASRHGHVPLGWGVMGGDGGGMGEGPRWLGDTFYGWGEKREVSYGGGLHGYILGPKHYTQSNGGASRMTSPPSTLDIYIYFYTHIHVISPPWGKTAGSDAW